MDKAPPSATVNQTQLQFQCDYIPMGLAAFVGIAGIFLGGKKKFCEFCMNFFMHLSDEDSNNEEA
jgi:hypothetical protein